MKQMHKCHIEICYYYKLILIQQALIGYKPLRATLTNN